MFNELLKNARLVVIALSTVALTGCLLPNRPKDKDFLKVEAHNDFKVYTMKREHKPSKTMRPTTKSLIFITADTFLSEQFQPQLDKAAGGASKAPTLNQLAWWAYQPLLADIYNKVAYIDVHQAKHAVITDAISYMERQGQPYDLIILSHGIPNHLTTGEVGYFMSFKEIQDLGKLKNLNLVFVQACFGKTLVQDWLNAGARRVMSFEGFNRNFFFVGVFLDHHRFYDEDGAFYTANRDMAKELDKKKLYKELIKRGLGTDIDGYLAEVEQPILDKSTR